MSVARMTVKYSAAGAMTALYGLVIYQKGIKKQEQTPVGPFKVAGTAAAMIALTWAATLL